MKVRYICFSLILPALATALYLASHADSEKRKLAADYQDLTARHANLSRLFIQSLGVSQQVFIPDTLSLTDPDHHKTSLGRLISGRDLIFLRVTSSNCGSFMQSQLEILKQSPARRRVVVLLSSQNYNDLQIFKNVYRLPFPVYQISPESLEANAVETINRPYFFTKSLGKAVSHVFVPDGSLPELSAAYLEEASRVIAR